MTSKRLTPPSGPKTKQGNRQKTKLLQIFILLEEKNHQRQLFPMVVFASPPRLISGTVWPQLSPRPPVPPTTATQPQWFLRPLVVSPVSPVSPVPVRPVRFLRPVRPVPVPKRFGFRFPLRFAGFLRIGATALSVPRASLPDPFRYENLFFECQLASGPL